MGQLTEQNTFLIKLKKNIGFGIGIKKGLSQAKSDFIIYAYTDLEVNPNNISWSIKIDVVIILL